MTQFDVYRKKNSPVTLGCNEGCNVVFANCPVNASKGEKLCACPIGARDGGGDNSLKRSKFDAGPLPKTICSFNKKKPARRTNWETLNVQFSKFSQSQSSGKLL